MMRTLSFFLIVSFLTACAVEENQNPIERIGMKPIYAKSLDATNVKSLLPQEFQKLGKIVSTGTSLFINDLLQGIHVVDIKDPANPIKIGFLSITGNVDFTIEGSLLYADNSKDLYVIDIKDIHDIKVLNTVANIYNKSQSDQLIPPDHSGFFECVDESMGIVIGWEEQLLSDPKCSL